MEDWHFGALMMGTFISWLIFVRLSMARIERAMKRDGVPRPCPWDGPGARIVLYAYAIALPQRIAERMDIRLIDVPLVRRYASHADWFPALVFLIVGHSFVVSVFI